MNAELREKWIKALRSGKYKQTSGSLCRTDSEGKPAAYCCLGVLCEVISKYDKSIEAELVKNNFNNFVFYRDIKSGSALYNSLNEKLRHRLEMKKLDHDCLIVMNDSGQDFNSIATYIKDNM